MKGYLPEEHYHHEGWEDVPPKKHQQGPEILPRRSLVEKLRKEEGGERIGYEYAYALDRQIYETESGQHVVDSS